MTYSETYLAEVAEIAGSIAPDQLEAMAEGIAAVRERGGRLFILGVGGGAGHASRGRAGGGGRGRAGRRAARLGAERGGGGGRGRLPRRERLHVWGDPLGSRSRRCCGTRSSPTPRSRRSRASGRPCSRSRL